MSISPIDVQKALLGIRHPADREELIETAGSNGADDSPPERPSDLGREGSDGPDEVSRAPFDED
ncbi:hypothetical protein ACFVHB_06475 [Kitasatospora sp. NPDC127111]|uniref:DUF2795 domain-containing protein n=1 Tax=Kitasatospora sp. NPDC127111 TaxID=3345363 RepID=UPI0036311264